ERLTVIRASGARRDGIRRSLEEALGRQAVVAAPLTGPAPRAGEDRAGEGDGGAVATSLAEVAAAEAAVAKARADLDAAERADAQTPAAAAAADSGSVGVLEAAEARLEVARAAAAAARLALAQAKEVEQSEKRERREREDTRRHRVGELERARHDIEGQRAMLAQRLEAMVPARDPRPVEEALEGLRRLRQVKPRPSERAIVLADRWSEVRRQLSELPSPPAPPEWLLSPALGALQEARSALQRAEADAGDLADPEKVDAVERAHREVLEAEQRVMRKGSRANRRRLEQAQEAEVAALQDVGVSTYGEYLQRIAPGADGASTREERVAIARAALADAEAVWEELHGGQASAEYTSAKEVEAEIRREALSLLGGSDVDDIDLEGRLREHVETVVDTAWAEQRLRDALVARGVALGTDDDPEEVAVRWLADAPALAAERASVEGEIADLEARARQVAEELAEQGGDPVAEGVPADEGPPDRLSDLVSAVDDAETGEREAENALAAARADVEASEAEARAAVAAAERARRQIESARAVLAAAEADLARVRSAADEAARDDAARADPAPGSATTDAGGGAPPHLGGAALFLARLVGARSAASGKPVVVDSLAVPREGLRLLERAADAGQVILLGDDAGVAVWVKKQGSRAAVRSI
ncbi:MAG TPA: hypothetical protein VFV35_04680, partial [Acidimicrobiales bacterium]|nr:hypothetical protein [Acidimicrobiales bacterium]